MRKRPLHFCSGKTILKVLPTPGSEDTSSFPPEDSMNLTTMGRPRPLPLVPLVV
jgi:hypothetical protein